MEQRGQVLGPVTLVKPSKQQLYALHPQGYSWAGRGQLERISMEGLSERHKTERKRKGKKEGHEQQENWNKVSEVSERPGVYLPLKFFGWSD